MKMMTTKAAIREKQLGLAGKRWIDVIDDTCDLMLMR
jgi:hypothetical protein